MLFPGAAQTRDRHGTGTGKAPARISGAPPRAAPHPGQRVALIATGRTGTIYGTMRHRIVRILWVTLALLFLLETWLWDHLKPLVAAVVGVVPWGKVKDLLRRGIESLPPWAALIVFVIPLIVLLPLKFLEVYFLATRNWLGAAFVLVLAKLLGLGITAFVFDATRDKLLQMAWFRRFYAWVMWARDWAHEKVEPVRERVRQYIRLLRPQRAGRFLRRLMRIRRRAMRA